MSDSFVLTVSALNRYVKSLLDSDLNLQNVFVKGEISNFKAQFSSGHYYFTLKDEGAQIRAAMFRNSNRRLRFMPENSMSVIVRGHISLYEQGGEYQLIVDDMQPDGTGALALAFEQLKKKLEGRGWFDKSSKKKIPAFPSKVGVITSKSGAAVRDIINVISRRYPLCEIILFPVSVQGDTSAYEISRAVNYMNANKCADVIIVGRGGGSIEDLWSFNEETVAKAVFESEIPVISAVGHETDFTICDFVADLRAPTPSAAAELAVPDITALREYIAKTQHNNYSCALSYISRKQSNIKNIERRIESGSPQRFLDSYRIKVDAVYGKISRQAETCISLKQKTLHNLIGKIDSMNPISVLNRGYSLVYSGDKIVSDSSSLNRGDILSVRLKNGSFSCEVTDNEKL